MKHAWIKFIETRGKGSFDKKRTGTEMTNGKGMNCLQNFNKITKAMISMYDVNTQEHEWLKKRSPDWERLAKALFEVHCFFKSQKRETRKNATINCTHCGVDGRMCFRVRILTNFMVLFARQEIMFTSGE